MDEIKLTRDADALICVLYREYLRRRKQGIPKAEARYFGSSESIHSEFMSKWLLDDVDSTCMELDEAGLMECAVGDCVVYDSMLTACGIIYMETRFKDGLASLVSHLEALFSLIPW